MSVSELLDEIARASVRCVEEAWKETPRPTRDGTRMIMISEPIFERLETAVRQLIETGEYISFIDADEGGQSNDSTTGT